MYGCRIAFSGESSRRRVESAEWRYAPARTPSLAGEFVGEDVGGDVSGGVAGRESGEACGEGDRERRRPVMDVGAMSPAGALGGDSILGSFDQGMFKSFTVCTF